MPVIQYGALSSVISVIARMRGTDQAYRGVVLVDDFPVDKSDQALVHPSLVEIRWCDELDDCRRVNR